MQHGFDFISGVTCRVETTDNGAHTGSGDVIDRYLQRFKRLEHSHVRSTAGAPAAQGKANPGSICLFFSVDRNETGSEQQTQNCSAAHGSHQDLRFSEQRSIIRP